MCDAPHRIEPDPPTTVGVGGLVEELVVATTSVRMYYDDHPRVRESVQALAVGLEELLGTAEAMSVDVGVAEGCLFVDRRPLLGASLAAARVISPLAEIGAGGISLRRGASSADFLALVRLLAQTKFDFTDHREANRKLEADGCRGIELLPPFRRGGVEASGTGAVADPDSLLGNGPGVPDVLAGEPLPDRPTLDIPVRLYQDVVDRMQDAMVSVCNGEALDLTRSQDCVENLLTQLVHDPKSILSISRYELYDAFTFGHSIRVCLLALSFARALGIEGSILQRIGTAALMHDIGKARVPFEILHSKGRLDAEERLEMSRHTLYGADILLEVADPDPMAVVAAFGHHRSKGGGYPPLAHDMRLSAGTRIVKICDVFEALTAVRPYKDRMSAVRAYRIMMSMPDHFDPALLRRFIQLTGVYPVGSRVRLSTGEIARVQAQSELLDLPVVDVEATPEGEPLHADQRRRLDLARDGGSEGVTVTETLLGAELS